MSKTSGCPSKAFYCPATAFVVCKTTLASNQSTGTSRQGQQYISVPTKVEDSSQFVGIHSL
jgi:hypothetical protein